MNDWWTGYQFDNAVMYFGRAIDAKLSQYDAKGKPKHRLTDLLRDPIQISALDQLLAIPGLVDYDEEPE